MLNYKTLKIEKKGRIATITLDRPDVLNAVNGQMHAELATVFEEAGKDESIDVIIIKGSGRAFSAGGDIHWMEDNIRKLPNSVEITVSESRKIIDDLIRLDKPVIAALNGDAIGLGATIALFCDIIVASEKARIGDPHVKVGLVAGDGGAVIWPLLVGIAKAKEFLLTGDLIDAREAERIGLINRVVEHEKLYETANEIATKLANGPRQAIRYTKLVLNKWLKDATTLILDSSIALEGHTLYDADHKEAVRAFIEKRKPVFALQLNPSHT